MSIEQASRIESLKDGHVYMSRTGKVFKVESFYHIDRRSYSYRAKNSDGTWIEWTSAGRVYLDDRSSPNDLLEEVSQNKSFIEQLVEYDKEKGIVARHVDWGSGGIKMSVEEKAGFLLAFIKNAEEQMRDSVRIPVLVLINLCDTLHALKDLSRASIDELEKMPDSERKLRHQIWTLTEFPAMAAEQYLPIKLKVERARERLRKAGVYPATERE